MMVDSMHYRPCQVEAARPGSTKSNWRNCGMRYCRALIYGNINNRVARQACEARYLTDRLVLAVEHPPHLSNHCHRDHPQTPCLKN
jgi:hypothetical protein